MWKPTSQNEGPFTRLEGEGPPSPRPGEQPPTTEGPDARSPADAPAVPVILAPNPTVPVRWKLPSLAVCGYMGATLVAFMDSNLLAPNLTAAGQSFGFNAEERDWKLGGELAFGYFVIAAPMALVVGSLADAVSRRWLFAVVLLLGKLPCLLTYFVQTYPQLFVLRTMMGITIGAVPPLASSLAGDMFPVASRTMATAVWSSCSGLGTLVGQYIAGRLGPIHGWQLPFLVVAVPGLLTAVLVLFLPEPIRGRHEEAFRSQFEMQAVAEEGEEGAVLPFTYRQKVTVAKALALFTVPSNVLGFLQGVPGCIPWGVVYAYFNDFLAQEKGMSVQAATQLMVVFGAAVGAGSVLGGLLGQRIYNRWKAGMPLLMGASTIVGIFPTLFLINYTFRADQMLLLHLLAVVAGLLVSITGGNIRTVFLNVNPPEVRGTVFGIFCITDDVGKGLGPFFAASLIAWMGRVAAFNVSVWMWAVCGVLLGAIGFFLEKDEHRMQRQLAVYVEMETLGPRDAYSDCCEGPVPALEARQSVVPVSAEG
eukprot:GGOE01055903.1.p1 GENE.GGOE01055903.1~~GGOE01055903.1.p1  ORF type:complete len:535 (-),score=165.26 GGOE01055903.1:132-1736(-)